MNKLQLAAKIKLLKITRKEILIGLPLVSSCPQTNKFIRPVIKSSRIAVNSLDTLIKNLESYENEVLK